MAVVCSGRSGRQVPARRQTKPLRFFRAYMRISESVTIAALGIAELVLQSKFLTEV